MKQLTLNIADNKFKAFLKFIETLDYVKVEEVDGNLIEGIENGLTEVKQIKEGKISKQSAKDFLNEL